eukprot:7560373-Alexandrium_andersonii.AAC.1
MSWPNSYPTRMAAPSLASTCSTFSEARPRPAKISMNLAVVLMNFQACTPSHSWISWPEAKPVLLSSRMGTFLILISPS